jgi:hypothetical protein
MGQNILIHWWQALNASTCTGYYFVAFLSESVTRVEHYMTKYSGDNKEVTKNLKFHTYNLTNMQLNIRTGTGLFRARLRIFGF